MKKIRLLLRSSLFIILLKAFLLLPLFSTFTACGDEDITGPRIEEQDPDPNDRGGGDESE